MTVLLAYILVVVLVQFCLTLGTLIAGFAITLCLSWLPDRMRAPIAGALAGIAGVTTAVAFGYLVFRFIAAPASYGIGPFLASTVPLAVPILNDRKRALQLAVVEQQLPEAAKALAAPTTASARWSFVGYILGLLLAAAWFFLFRPSAA